MKELNISSSYINDWENIVLLKQLETLSVSNLKAADLEHFKEQAKTLNITEHVSMPGRVNNVAQILPACAFAVHPSKGEVGYSLSILEYMRAGLPVIVPGNPSVCGATIDNETGLLYQDECKYSCVESIKKLLTNSDQRRSMGLASSKQQASKYNLENCHNQLIIAFKVLI
mgnify:CR=1 FL=1